MQKLLETGEDRELLPLVIEQLQDIQDLMSCASVSRSFRQARQHIRPAAIVLQPVRSLYPSRSQTTIRNSGSRELQRWFVLLSQQGCLQDLKSVVFSTVNVQSQVIKQIFWCPLQRCELDSVTVDVRWVIDRLPSTISRMLRDCSEAVERV